MQPDAPVREVPLFSVEAEMSVLGGACIDSDAALEAADGCTREMFSQESHRLIFDALLALIRRGEAIDTVTIVAELERVGTLERAGGAVYLSHLLDAVPTAANIRYHIGILRRLFTRRQLIRAGKAIALAASTRDEDVAALVDEAGREIFRIAQEDSPGGLVGISELLLPAMQRIETLTTAGSAITGVPSGFRDLDQLTAGFQKGDLVIVAARPSMGKTALALNLATAAAIDARRPVAFFSLEMSRDALVARLLCSEARVDGSRVRTGKLRDEDYPRIATAAGILNAAPIFIDETPAITVMQMRARCRRLQIEKGDLGMVVVDYLQLVHATGENRTQVVGEISRGLKAMAKELDVPVIALSQLSRAVESRQDKRPMMSDLRESGQIEQDADVILFLYRPEVYLGATDKDGNNLEGRAELIVAKQRNGATGVVHLVFHKEYTRFESFSSRVGQEAAA